MDGWLAIIDAVAREATLFAAVGLLIGGLDDLLVDLFFLLRCIVRRDRPVPPLATLPFPTVTGRIAVFVPAWDEAQVIGAMLTTALARFDHRDYRIYVGLYPNDRATIVAVAAIAAIDVRVRMVIGGADGPTTKADCLNTLWAAMCRDEVRSGVRIKAVVLHDAEDVVHAAELRIFDTLIEGRSVVQLPVRPLVKRGSRLVSGHYADEFAEAHGKQLVVRTALGAAMPLAGTGCAIARDTLAAVAMARGGSPFDAVSLTEDYELGLRIAELGGRGLFARIAEAPGGSIVAVHAYFPADIDASVRQKARWLTGIALAGWDRTGWARPAALADHWMRMRDRRAPIAFAVLVAAYVALIGQALTETLHWYDGSHVPADVSPASWLLLVNTALLAWRLIMRMVFTGSQYGLGEALWSIPRFLVGNYVALIAAPRAFVRYIGMLRGKPPVWDKTPHEFPDLTGIRPN